MVREKIMPKLVICCGIPASGKNHHIDNLTHYQGERFVQLNADMVRAMVTGDESDQSENNNVFKCLHLFTRILLLQGINVIISNTNYNFKNRKEFIKIGQSCGAQIHALVFNTPYETCAARNAARRRVVPIHILEKMRDGWQEPTRKEGFDNIQYIEYKE